MYVLILLYSPIMQTYRGALYTIGRLRTVQCVRSYTYIIPTVSVHNPYNFKSSCTIELQSHLQRSLTRSFCHVHYRKNSLISAAENSFQERRSARSLLLYVPSKFLTRVRNKLRQLPWIYRYTVSESYNYLDKAYVAVLSRQVFLNVRQSAA